MLRDAVPTHAFRLALVLAAWALPAGLAGCDDPTRATPVGSVEVTAPDTRLDVGQTLQLSAAVKDASGAELADRSVSWSSSNAAVATVENGLVTGRAPGQATITAAAGGKQGQLEVTVDPAAARITMEPDSFTLVLGSTVTIQLPTGDHQANARARILAVPRDASGGVMVGRTVRFTSSDERIATVGQTGEVRPVAVGTVTITARTGGAEGRLTLTVERPYTLTYLGTLPGLPESRATAINELGQVAGYASPSAASNTGSRGFVWQDGRLTEVTLPDTLGDGLTVLPAAINERGQAGVIARTFTRQLVALWESGRSTVATAPGPRGFVRLGMNDRGEIVGAWMNDFCTRNCDGGGWIFRDGVVTPLSNYGFLRISPQAINNAGQITGAVYSRGSGTESSRAFFLASATAPEPTFLPTSNAVSQGLDIDEQGRVVGQDLSGGALRAFLWPPGGAVAHPALLRAGSISAAEAMNSRGLSVGYSNCTGCEGFVPVLFREGKAVRVNDLFVPGDWSFTAVTDINDRGQIVGYGRHRTSGATGALLLTPP